MGGHRAVCFSKCGYFENRTMAINTVVMTTNSYTTRRDSPSQDRIARVARRNDHRVEWPFDGEAWIVPGHTLSEIRAEDVAHLVKHIRIVDESEEAMGAAGWNVHGPTVLATEAQPDRLPVRWGTWAQVGDHIVNRT